MHNKIKALWEEGKPAVNIFVTVPSTFVAELTAQAGWDAMTVDLQHGLQDYQSLVACFQGMQGYDLTPLARVPSNEFGIIGKVLDAGAYGVICPMVNTRQEAEAFVAACRYPPAGRRSSGPIRASLYGAKAGYHKTANDEVLCIPMIETREAVANIDQILDVAGIDAIYIGPNDLAISYGYPTGQDRQEPELIAVFRELRAKTRQRGIRACLHSATPTYALQGIGMGFDLVTVSNDARIIQAGAKQIVDTVRKGITEREPRPAAEAVA